jgi:hypothetical protein
LTRIDTTDAGREQINAGQSVSEYIMRSDLTAQDVTQYKIKGYWYFDKGELKYRLLDFVLTPNVYTMNSDEKDYMICFGYFSSGRDVFT